jgi:hypothetical protein
MSHGRQDLGTPCEILGRRGLVSCDARCDPPIEKLRKYEPESDADYRHRMLVNFFATVVIIVLMVTGSWMVDTIISYWPR